MSEQKLRRASIGLHAAPGVRPAPEMELHSPLGGTESLASAYGVALLEHRLALLHGTDSAVVTSDRLSALALVASHLMVPGDNMVCADQIGGQTYAFLEVACPRMGYDVRFISRPWELDRWEECIDERTQLLLVECPSDPNMFVPDLEALAALARDHFIPLVVDTTVATPVVCRASEWGAELVICSLSGDLTGHAFAEGGAVMGDIERTAKLREVATHSPGCCLHPFSAAMCLIGMESLFDRMRTKRENTSAVRSFLLERRAEGEITFVNHPSLRKHPQYGLSRKYTDGFAGSLVSFAVRGGEKAARALCSALRTIAPATSPGSSRTTICHPYSTSHASLSPEQKSAAVILPEMLRLSVGNEDPADILEDLERGFETVG